MNIYKNAAESFSFRFGGTDASKERCEAYLKPDHTFLFGVSFKDAKSNYKLLDRYDLMNLGLETREACKQTKSSPFDDLLLIVYKNNEGKVNFKLLNGMASILVEEMVKFCEEENLKNTGL